ncbi:MAG: hypothetical protein LUO84_01865 [Methanomassiliicoccales archaeon]|nr:hypothetical protein [Methanomassiliicoccales archaeon]
MFCEVGQWRIRKEFSKKHFELWKEILDDQKSHSGKSYRIRSRILQSAEKEANPDEETWMVIDEYEDREAYDKMYKAWEKDPEIKKLDEKWHSKLDPMMSPGSLKAQLWIERAKVELEK